MINDMTKQQDEPRNGSQAVRIADEVYERVKQYADDNHRSVKNALEYVAMKGLEALALEADA